MKSIFFDCSLGISGDMLASALFDLGVPESVFFDNLEKLKIDNNYKINFDVRDSFGIKGISCTKTKIEFKELSRSFTFIKNFILASSLNDFVKKKSIKVFEILAQAEAVVHGNQISDIHFHELGSIDSIIDIINVCSAMDFLKPENIYFSSPPAGKGVVSTSHGLLPVPVPTVVEIAKQNKIPLMSLDDKYNGEITTPTGIALMAVFLDKLGQPDSINIKKIGIGLGHKNISRPNFLRVLLTDQNEGQIINNNNPTYENITFQEAWIDDSTPEDISILIERLRGAGAIDVICHSVDMKKNRKGVSIQAIVHSDNETLLREVWFNYSTTLGLRENKINRWILPRRMGKYKTKLGEINYKKAMRPNGQISIKIEHKDLSKISLNTGIPIEEIRHKVFMELSDLYELDNWSE
ncbi:nickel pincer cofactor biosynthesis protein LarC [Prochlorococcus marinus]|uniref:Putative nickel insertion protein n=1 Tax=Prochlorococcus marinus XMU1408 TaxID=2213228 RepID=A0A318R4T2_PROMR|nr:nickel pincer cofactor biosynthesis protein LarC [Prochlorococcus marinus]MBW3041514.1 TIGR00299 family protein [Prochlorococcus marinus str. XMU1408]PYE02672.1 nickel pincer cofactor biosynthesis protein LarC [Prochlorococcus marinus XMU1408]